MHTHTQLCFVLFERIYESFKGSSSTQTTPITKKVSIFKTRNQTTLRENKKKQERERTDNQKLRDYINNLQVLKFRLKQKILKSTSKIYKSTTIYMFNKSHLLKAKRYSIKIHTFYVYSKYNLIKEIKNSDIFRLLY